jgi:hypothetical protein
MGQRTRQRESRDRRRSTGSGSPRRRLSPPRPAGSPPPPEHRRAHPRPQWSNSVPTAGSVGQTRLPDCHLNEWVTDPNSRLVPALFAAHLPEQEKTPLSAYPTLMILSLTARRPERAVPRILVHCGRHPRRGSRTVSCCGQRSCGQRGRSRRCPRCHAGMAGPVPACGRPDQSDAYCGSRRARDARQRPQPASTFVAMTGGF